MQAYYTQRIGGVLALASLLAAALFSLHRAHADYEFRLQSPEAVARAVALDPGNTEYLAFRALQLDYAGADPRPLLENAAQLNPLSSAPRIRLGLIAEMHGDFATAEERLLDAARIDHQYEPRWTLANFYFRRENRPLFWQWMRAALAVSYGDRRPAFDLCWRVSTDAAEILDAMPPRSEVLAAYVSWLLETDRTGAAAPVAMKIAGDPAYKPLLLDADDALLDRGNAAPALALWQSMGFAAPAGVYRGNFAPPAIARGFDWRWTEVAGVLHTEIGHAEIGVPRTTHRISFDGRQPESCDLLSQFVLTRKAARYRLSWDASVTQIGLPTGLEWRIGGARAPVANGHGEMEWIAPADLVRLKLMYQRPMGEVRAEGSVELWGVTLKPIL